MIGKVKYSIRELYLIPIKTETKFLMVKSENVITQHLATVD
ncbi:hypothetical protein RINTHH_17640 [Richelia intracellularis HH01]|uniref:Uncharacterized protein n=1 Tax=Richelia intracellularis HH01 TaxID=1165094 RepID=M1WT89_9NOST|nr:hypothetical protein RINTHH_17640 [Richelia intracellularis HH01]